MANIQINIIENGKTTLATQGCICDRNIDINVDVPTVSGGGGGENQSDYIPNNALHITGDPQCKFYGGNWDWFLEMYGDQITTSDIISGMQMFQASRVVDIPFDINFKANYNVGANYLFGSCSKLESISGKVVNLKPTNMLGMFNSCSRLRALPEFVNPDFSYVQVTSYASMSQLFNGCSSLREIPEDILKELWGCWTTANYSIFNSGFKDCYVLDEIRGVNPKTGTVSANLFSGSFDNCHRVKDIIFATNNGTPYVLNWKNQIIDLTKYIGYAFQPSYGSNPIMGYNATITADKEVTDDASYQALKNDPDWFTFNIAYSRYNHDSAVNTINSLPDVSASGGTNTIKFKGTSGSATDGGAINTLTEEEIAVATAKGWTVQIV